MDDANPKMILIYNKQDFTTLRVFHCIKAATNSKISRLGREGAV
jgi:hypothetical protein